MTIVMTGGGTGGHITPALAVARELKRLRPDVEIIYIGQRGDGLGDIPEQDTNIDRVYTVRAGKFRRYHGEGWRQLLDLPTMFKNLRDAVWVVAGLWQSFWLLGKLRPNVIFTRGSFVSVPVCLAAAARHIPYTTHDTDAVPSLANRIIARWARVHAVALPKEMYAHRYPAAKTVTVGIPIAPEYRPVSAREQAAVRKRLGLDGFSHVLLVTGGGNGALLLNNAVAACAPELLERYPKLAIVQLAGRKMEAALRQRYRRTLPPELQKHAIVKGFVTNLYDYSAAANVVISRAGGTSLAEFAAQAKPCVVVPNPLLTGGHQMANARLLVERKAIRVVDSMQLQADAQALMPPLTELLDHPDRAQALGSRLAKFSQPNAANRLAMLLLEIADNGRTG